MIETKETTVALEETVNVQVNPSCLHHYIQCSLNNSIFVLQ